MRQRGIPILHHVPDQAKVWSFWPGLVFALFGSHCCGLTFPFSDAATF